MTSNGASVNHRFITYSGKLELATEVVLEPTHIPECSSELIF